MANGTIIQKTFKVTGDNGDLFSVDDSVTGILHSVADISGIPIFKVEDTGDSTFSGDLYADSNLIVTGEITVNGSILLNDLKLLQFGTLGAESELSSDATDTVWKLKNGILQFKDASDIDCLKIYPDGLIETTATDIEIGSSLANFITGSYYNNELKPPKTVRVGYAVSDEDSSLTTGTSKVSFRLPIGMTISEVRASVTTAPTGSVLTIDVNESGVSILSTKITIDAGEKTSVTAAIPPVISDTILCDDAEMTIDIDTVGSTIAGTGLKIWLIGVEGSCL